VTIDHVVTLIIAPPGRFRDSLRVLLRAGDQISLIGQADNGSSGLKMIDANRPFLVLLDAGLPDGCTWDVLKQIKREWPQVRCLVLTHTQEQQRIAQTAGADRILMDGFTTESLFSIMQTLISEITHSKIL